MLKLSLGKREPYWLDASGIGEGARIKVAPITPAMILVARDAASRVIATGVTTAPALTAEEDAVLAGAEGQAAFTRALARRGILGWEGFGDQDGKAIEPTPDAIDAMLADWTLFEFIDHEYVGPELMRIQEKNAFSPSQSGTSRAEKPIARGVKTSRKKPAKSARTK